MGKAGRILLIIGSVWIFIICGCGYFSLIQPGIGTRWKQEPTPPERVSLLKLGNAGEIIAETTNGNLYEFTYGKNSSWKKVAQPTKVAAIGMDCSPGDANYIVLPPPGKVVSRVSENCVYIESAYHLRVALMDNGAIWSWEYEGYAYTQLAVISILSIACIVGALIIGLGLVLVVIQMMKKKTT
jgi:hypothetical protein